MGRRPHEVGPVLASALEDAGQGRQLHEAAYDQRLAPGSLLIEGPAAEAVVEVDDVARARLLHHVVGDLLRRAPAEGAAGDRPDDDVLTQRGEDAQGVLARSEERRVGKASVSTGRYWWWP